MKKKSFKDFEALWTTEKNKWVLLKSRKNIFESVMPFDLETSCLLVIEDNEIGDRVVEEMKKAGNKIITEIPKIEE